MIAFVSELGIPKATMKMDVANHCSGSYRKSTHGACIRLQRDKGDIGQKERKEKEGKKQTGNMWGKKIGLL